MINLTAVFLANPDVICQQNGCEAVLINPDTDAIIAINPPAQRLWQALADPHSQSQLIAKVLDETIGAPCAQVSNDVDQFLCTLLPNGFIGELLPPGVTPADTIPASSTPGEINTPDDNDEKSAELVGEGMRRFYRGRSMLGTFRPGDRLTINPVSFNSLQKGDVIIYQIPSSTGVPREIVHRVEMKTPRGIVMRGDNNTRPDRILMTQDHFIGQVSHYFRNSHLYPVANGFWGIAHLRRIQAIRFVRHLCADFLRATVGWLYYWLRDTNLMGRLFPLSYWRLLVHTPIGLLVKYVYHNRTVAIWRPRFNRFYAHRPYDLLIMKPEKADDYYS